ncbi:MAG: GIY-YIG nuclease family protein [bacterium]
MAKCSKCGKSGIFFKVNSIGKCKECEHIEKLLEEEASIKSQIEMLTAKRIETEKSYETIKTTRDTLYNQISEKAKKDALQAIQSEIDSQNSKLTNLRSEIDNSDKQLQEITLKTNESEKQIVSNANKLLKIKTQFKSLQYSVKRYNDYEEIPSQILNETEADEADELLSTTIKLKLHLMDIRELKKHYSQNNKLIRELLIKYQSRYTTKANLTIYRLMVISLEAELQNALYNLSYSKLDKSIKDIKAITAKYQKIATDGNQNIASTIIKFIGEIEFFYIEAIKIEYEYFIQKERIKEEQKAISDQIRQEAAERKKLEAERKKIEQEELKYENEIDSIKQIMAVTVDNEKVKQLEERLAKIQAQLDEVEKKKDEITHLQNGKAGYIYIISNLGSFGEKTFKVGMTRRINPQDRVDELGDASVPFAFDVHSFIFSEDAPDLEYKLHKQLHNSRVNKVNLRKEFFNTTIDELEDLVYSLEPSAEFNRTMLAEQYNQSMSIDEVPDDVIIVDDELPIDEDEEESES